jgi:hypothetical protein
MVLCSLLLNGRVCKSVTERRKAAHRVLPAALGRLRFQFESHLPIDLPLAHSFSSLTHHHHLLTSAKMSHVARRGFMKNWFAVEVGGSLLILVSVVFGIGLKSNVFLTIGYPDVSPAALLIPSLTPIGLKRRKGDALEGFGRMDER